MIAIGYRVRFAYSRNYSAFAVSSTKSSALADKPNAAVFASKTAADTPSQYNLTARIESSLPGIT